MERTSLVWLVGLLVAMLVSSGLYWFANTIGLAVATGLVWGTGVATILHIGWHYPSYTTGDEWGDKRWTGLSTGLVTLAATIGVSPTLPVRSELRLGLGFLVVGVGFVGYTAATMAEIERNTA
ncbi:sterol desaturase [Haloferax larsenii]|uniref:Sterol desaturase n=1 Tax=Haloferax larsenii TaxID=302484 RepID=A0ABY5REB5_HALLR|nr:hypothetical protein [Haloferax larsenii]ELZ81387.1 sterol desaturase family protein [Haloferax larsenii JCM 13917]UVE49808.1 sterol desaturase [Haloferax larsenii]